MAMNDTDKQKPESEEKQQMKLPTYAVYDWALDIKSQTFSCDEEGQQLLFGEVYDRLPVSKLLRLVPTQQRNKVKQAFKRALSRHQEQYLHCCLLVPDSLFIYVELYIYRSDEHQLTGTISPCLVIPDAQQAAEIFFSVFENRHHGVVVTDAETRILACNQYFESMTGYLRNELVGLKTNIFNSESHHDEHYQRMWRSIEEKGFWNGVLLSRHASGSVFPQDLTIQRITPNHGERYFIGFGSDMSANLASIEDIESGGVDLLTQLPTAEHFLTQLTKQCDKADKNNTILVLAIQPDFSGQNNQKLKQAFAAYMREKTTAQFCGYMDSGRFLACLPISVKHPQQRVRDIARTLKTFFHCFKHASLEVYEALKSGLLGVSIYGVDAETPNRLVSHACQAILELHSGESRRIAFYDRDIHLQVERKKRLENHVQQALANNTIEVYFQPIVDVKQQRISKFEALCRFPVVEGEEARTQDFIAIAEDMNRILELDDKMTMLAFRQFKLLQQHFGEEIKLSINRSLNCDADLADVLKRIALALDDEGLSPESLIIEFTESAFLESDDDSARLIQFLRDAGVSIAVDDFGTGCASFHYLKQRFFDVLKIDRQFIRGLTAQSRESDIVSTLINLSHQLGLTVVAEGVETEQELGVLMQLGVDEIQGFLFARPEPIDRILIHEHYCQWPKGQTSSLVTDQTLMHLATRSLHHLDPGDPLSLAFQYFASSENDYLPVVDERKCVGLLERSSMHLHMTPNMGTDLENNRERENWNKSVNRMMAPLTQVLDWQRPLNEVKSLVNGSVPFPWVLVDEHGEFKGLVEMSGVLNHLSSG